MSSIEQRVVHVDQANDLGGDEQAGIEIDLLFESDSFEVRLKMVEEVSGRLLQTVQTLLQLVYLPRFPISACHFNMSTSSRLFFRSHLIPVGRVIDIGMDEGSGVVDLLCGKFQLHRQDQ